MLFLFLSSPLHLVCTLTNLPVSSYHFYAFPFAPSGLPPLLTLLLLCCFFFLLRSSVLECRQRLRGSTSPWRRVKGRIFQRSLASGKQEDNNKKPFSLQKLHLTPGSVMFSVNEEIPWKCKVKMSSLFGKRVFSQAQ